MNPLLSYIIRSAVYLAGFYLVYYLLLSRDTSYPRNRFYLLASLLLSLVIPFINISTGNSNTITYIGKTFSDIIVLPGNGELQVKQPGSGIGVLTTIFRIYLAGLVFFGFKVVADMIRLIILILKNDRNEGNLIRISRPDTPGFSAFGKVFINSSLPDDEFCEVYKHEMNHLRLRHFYDVLFVEIVSVFQWFNPVIYMINRSLRSVHEYQADHECLMSGISLTGYQKMLFGQVLKSRSFLASNTFSNPSLLKKRMIMMTKKTSPRLADLKVLMVVPVIALLLAVISACGASRRAAYSVVKQEGPPAPEEVFVVVEEMPRFPGGEKAFLDSLYAKIQYPKEAMEKKIEGRVICRFCIRADGAVDRVTVIKGVDPLVDAEAIRVIKSINGWIPGKQGGLPVNVWYSVPVVFQLK